MGQVARGYTLTDGYAGMHYVNSEALMDDVHLLTARHLRYEHVAIPC